MTRIWPLAAAVALIPLAGAQTPSQLPPPKPDARQEFKLIHADTARFEGDEIELTGNVHAQFKGYDLYGDRVIGDKVTQVFRLEGSARIIGHDAEVFGSVVVINFKDDTFRFEDGRATLGPDRLQGETVEDIFLSSVSGSGRASLFETREGALTTCDKEIPHFLFTAESTRIRPGKNAALRNVKLVILGHTIFSIPFLVVPLVENGTRYLPDVGQSPDEGYYVKTRWSTLLNGDDYFDTRLDYMSRLGTGVGFDYNYENATLDGKFTAYTLIGQRPSTVLTGSHRQDVFGGSLTFNSRFEQQNYLTAPGTSIWNTRAQFMLPWGTGSSRLSWFRVSSDRKTSKSVSESFRLSDQRRFGGRGSTITTSFDANLARSESNPIVGQGTKSERLDLRFNVRSSFRLFDADLIYQRSVPIGDSSNFFNATDRTPMLTLRSDARRLIGPDFARVLAFTTEFSIGELLDPATSSTVTRINFDLKATKTLGGRRKSQLQLNGRFKQGLYSNDTAQYVIDYGARWSYQVGSSQPGRESTVNLSYRYLRAFGFTPLSIDRSGRSDALGLDVTARPTAKLQLSVRTGYDVLRGFRGRTPWQFISVQTEWNAGGARRTERGPLRINLTSSYDTINRVWSNVRLNAEFTAGRAQFAMGARYDARRSQWASANLVFEGLRIGKTTFAVALNYNGFTKRFDAQHYSIIYDLHAAELVLDIVDNQVGFRAGRQIGLFLRLKALPTRSGFGFGTRGQAVGSRGGFGF
ncbi:MAG: LPS-assembly protein LptD [Armatimonadetes bacterium]|nr:LPS-assembly protein LptD [Armatimonadota bacterium]